MMAEGGEEKSVKPPEFDNYRTYHFENPDRFKAEVPKGQADTAGPCLRVALFFAGIDTNLPRWTDTKYLPEICEELNLKLHQSGQIELPAKGNYIVTYNQTTPDGQRLGHCVHTENLRTTFKKVGKENVLSIIEVT